MGKIFRGYSILLQLSSKNKTLLGFLAGFLLVLITWQQNLSRVASGDRNLNCSVETQEEMVSIPLELPECSIPTEYHVMHVPQLYLKSCSIARHKFNDSSDRDTIILEALLPELKPVSEAEDLSNVISIRVHAYDCRDQDEDYQYSNAYKEDWIRKLPQIQSKSGDRLYSDPKQVHPNFVQYRALTDTRYHDRDIFIISGDNTHELLILRCRKDVCASDAELLLHGITISYAYDRKFLEKASDIETRVKFLLNTFFDQK